MSDKIEHSKNYFRYLEWYKKGSISEDQLDKLVSVKLITEDEKESIIYYKDIENSSVLNKE